MNRTGVDMQTRNRFADECFYELEDVEEPLFTVFDNLTRLLVHVRVEPEDRIFIQHCESSDIDINKQTKDTLLDEIKNAFDGDNTNNAKVIRYLCSYPDEFYSFYTDLSDKWQNKQKEDSNIPL